MKEKLSHLVNDQSGSLAVVAALLLLVLAGMAALVMDIGRLAVVKSEMQKAADAGALAGARALSSGPSFPNWTSAQSRAAATAQENKVDGSLITASQCQVQVGYWNYSWQPNTAPANLQSTGIVPTAQDVPAVKVTVSKGTSQLNGPLFMMFASVLGITTRAVSAQAVACAINQPVNKIDPGMAFPMAIPISFVTQLLGQSPPPAFRIGSSYHDPTGGQWTSFLSTANNVPDIQQLIDTGNPIPLQVGDQIYIAPGTKDTLFNTAVSRKGDTVMIPVVSDDFASSSQTPIQGFVAFHIDDAVGGSDKYIEGHFVTPYTVPGGIGAPGSPNFGSQAGIPRLFN
jgi:Flp pilus assembly protein TadG